MACDLAMPGYDILERMLVHHLEPIRIEDFEIGNEARLLGMDNLITVSHSTHNILTYGGEAFFMPPRERGDHCPWKQGS